jgi:hypothetical protein
VAHLGSPLDVTVGGISNAATPPAAPQPVLLAHVPFIRCMTHLGARAVVCTPFQGAGGTGGEQLVTDHGGLGLPAPVGTVPLFRVAAHLMADECTVDSQSPPHLPPVRMLRTHVRS